MPDYKPISTGMCAFGMSGQVFHGPLLHTHPGFSLDAVWQRSRQDATESYPLIRVYRQLEGLLADPKLELIIVNTPEPTHYPFAKAALEAGKHVVVEKAFTVTVQEAEELIALAKQKQRILSVYQNRRWDGDFLTVQQVVQQGLLGRLVSYEAHYDRYRNYIQADTWKEEARPGTGILYNLGSHLIDQALSLFGEPERVRGEVSTQRTGGRVPDAFDLILFYPNFKATLKASYLVREPGPRYTLHGTEGSFLKWGLDPQEDALKAGILPGSPNWGTEPESEWGLLNTEVEGLHVQGKVETLPGNYLAYYDNVYGAIRERKPLAVPGEAGLAVMQVIEAVMG